MNTAVSVLLRFQASVNQWESGVHNFVRLFKIDALSPQSLLIELIKQYGTSVSSLGETAGVECVVDTQDAKDPRVEAVSAILNTVGVRDDIAKTIGIKQLKPLYVRRELEDIMDRMNMKPLPDEIKPGMCVVISSPPHIRKYDVFRIPTSHLKITAEYMYLAPDEPSDSFPVDMPISVSLVFDKI